MELNKAITEITNILDTWLKDNSFDLTTRFEADFGYYHNENVVAFGLLTTVNNDEFFGEYVEYMGGSALYSFVNSFLHEVGHHMTYDDITDEEYEYGQKVKAFLADKKELDKYDYITYFNLPIEKVATEWGIKYFRNNPQSVFELNRKIKEVVDSITLNVI